MFVPHYVLCVMCHVSCVICHVSPEVCTVLAENILWYYNIKNLSKLRKKNSSEEIGQNGGASRWRVCYQQGLPCLVSCHIPVIIMDIVLNLKMPTKHSKLKGNSTHLFYRHNLSYHTSYIIHHTSYIIHRV